MQWRNVHHLEISELDLLMRDARMLRPVPFKMIYGPEVFVWLSADNTPRVASIWREPKITPIIRKSGERLSPPSKGDKIVIIEGDERRHGQITYVSSSDDMVGVLLYKTKDQDQTFESFSLDCLETSHDGRIRWRIHQ